MASSPSVVWPALPTTGFLSSRAATRDDVRAGNAVFVAVGTLKELELLGTDPPPVK
jgi:hypothetical protein